MPAAPLPSVAPFASTYTAELPDLLAGLRCSVALSTYQAGRVVVFSPNGDSLAQLNRAFDAPMGLGVAGEGAGLKLAVAEKAAVHVLANAPTLAAGYPRQPDTYDALLLPRQTLWTGPLDLHDLAFVPGKDGAPLGLVAVNTRFSCLCGLGGPPGQAGPSFTPLWSPPFISALAPEDRCHLNGLALDAGGRPAVVSALGQTDTPRGWSDGRLTGGVLLDVPSGEVIAGGLAMPHSPRLVRGADGAETLYVLLSATGLLATIDRPSGAVTEVCDLGGFARGVSVRGDYLFIGVSKIRKASTFAGLPVSERAGEAGLVVVHAPSGRIAARLSFQASVEEIYDVAVLPEVARPGIVGPGHDVLARALPTDAGGYWALDAPPEG